MLKDFQERWPKSSVRFPQLFGSTSSRGWEQTSEFYAALVGRLTFAHLARCAAAILRRVAADIVRLPSLGLAIGTTCFPFTLAQRAL